MSTLKQRFLLVSDMHYTTNKTPEELKKLYPTANAAAAAGNAFGFSQREKIDKIYKDIEREHNRSAIDAVFVLGDLSIDDYDFRKLPKNYCQRFKEECLDKLPFPYHVIPGNHDSYPDEIWQSIFGTSREFAIKIGNCAFILLDTFKKLPATSASGAPHTPVNDEFLIECLEKFKGNKIFLCSHYFESKTENNASFSERARELIKENQDIVFIYRGHTHKNNVIDMGETYGNKLMVDIGGYGYEGHKIDGRYEFNIFDYKWAWGYQILEIYDDVIKTYHIKTDMHYVGINGEFDVEETTEGYTEYTLNK